MIAEQRLAIRGPGDLPAIEAIPIEDRLAVTDTYAMFAAAAARHPDRLALRFLPNGTIDDDPVDYDYRTFFANVTRAANLFHSLGIRPGRVVASLLPNLPQTYFTLWGGEAAGIVCAINQYLEADHIGALLDHSKAEVLVIQGPSPLPIWEKLPRIRELAPGLRHILRVGPGPDGPDILDFDDALAEQPGDRLVGDRRFEPSEVAAYFHTGGTTGVPKITPLTHFNEVSATWCCLQMFSMTADDVVMCGMPLFHAGGIKVGGMFPHATGATVVLLGQTGFRNPDTVKQFWRLTERYGGTYVPSAPTVYSALLQVPIDADISTLTYPQVSAAPSPPELFRRFKAYSGLDLHEGYGLTEATLVTHANPRHTPPRHGSVGFRIPYVDHRAVKLAANGTVERDAATGEIGLVIVRGPTVFPGYLPPASSEGLWIDGGWLNTGDLGRLDADGYLWITGRQKDMIIRGGHNIDPETIETPMHAHPAVRACAAVGKPDAHAGEVPIAFVTLVAGGKADPETLLAHARETIGERAAVPKQIVMLDEMPLTAVGKIAKTELRNLAIRMALEEALAADSALRDNTRVEVALDPTHGVLATVLVEGGDANAGLEAKVNRALDGFLVRFRVVETA